MSPQPPPESRRNRRAAHAAEAEFAAAAEEVLRGIRAHRFGNGGQCPHCGEARLMRWGSFSGRQRYRCRSCRRTCSDLTGTALAYTKLLGRWRDYLLRFRDAQPLRRVAAALDIQVSTAFRWRHAILRARRQAEAAVALEGWVELQELTFALSFKGSRLPPNTARRRGARLTHTWTDTARARVVLARARRGGADAFLLNGPLTSTAELATHFRARIAPASTLLLGYRNGASYATAARQCGMRFISIVHDRPQPDPNRHVRNITAYSRRLRRWLLRFRGVASHYLDNYCAWHRMVDDDTVDAWLRRCFRDVAPRPRRG